MIPGAVLAFAALFLLQTRTSPPEVTAFLPFLPPLVFVAGLFLGCRFNRTRLVYVLLVLAFADLCLKEGGASFPLARGAVGVLLPLNLVLIAWYAERGLFTPVGALRLGLIAAQPIAVVVIHSLQPQSLAVFTVPFLPEPFPPGLPHPPLVATAVAATLLLLRSLRRPSSMEAGFFWVLLCAQLPLFGGLGGEALTLWFAVGGAILTAALVDSSHSMAFRDELTGISSRRALNEELLKMGRTYVLAMVDVDHFKKVNDTHGHDIGDQVLKMVASRLGKVTGGGRPFRFGGEEFAILFPGRTVEEAIPHLEGVRGAMEGVPFVLRHPSRPKKKGTASKVGTAKLSITVSIGVSERQHGCDAETVIKNADQALYKAKRGGRNRLCVQTVQKADRGFRK